MAASTTNPPQYAKDYVKCAECGVTWRTDSLVEEKRARGDVLICKDRERCQHWREVCRVERGIANTPPANSIVDDVPGALPNAVAGQFPTLDDVIEFAVPKRRGHISLAAFNELPEHEGLPPGLKAGDRWKTHTEERGPECGPYCAHWYLVDTYEIEGQPTSVGLSPIKMTVRREHETDARSDVEAGGQGELSVPAESEAGRGEVSDNQRPGDEPELEGDTE